MTLPSYSQTNSNNKTKDSLVLVPVKSLRKALIVLEEKNFLEKQVKIVRDSVSLLVKKVNNLDTVVKNQEKEIKQLKENQDDYTTIIMNKNSEIKYYKELYEKERRHKWVAIGCGSVATILAIIFL